MISSDSILAAEIPLTERKDPPLRETVDIDDRRLLNEALAGNTTAFHLLVERYQRALYLFCYKLLGDSDQARDVMQETWIRVARLQDAGRVANPGAFLYRIARNLCLDHLKAVRRRNGSLLSLFHLHEQERRTGGSMEDAVQSALATIPLKYREVLILRYYSGYRYDEIAGMMNISTGAVTMRHKRGLERMRRVIEEGA